jgi:Integrase core domain.
MGKFIMSKRESEQLSIFEKLKRKEISQRAAAAALGLTERWVREKAKRYVLSGPIGLVHKSRGKASNLKWPKDQEDAAIELLRGPFEGFGPTFAAEKLEEVYKIKVCNETLRQAMIRNGLWSNKAQRAKHRKRRERMICRGIMTQLDGSPHDWFEGRGPWCTLLVFIDDATSEFLWLEFAESESTKAIMQATKNYVTACGCPGSFYVDFGSVFSVNTNNPERVKITQFERATQELGIRVIHATSPQAKGRVERANKTLQDRLVKELRLARISTIEEANAFIKSGYLKKHNTQFAITAVDPTDAHRPLTGQNLDAIFCGKEERVLMNDFTIMYNKHIFQLSKQQKTLLRPRERIMVSEQLDGKTTLSIRAIALNFTEISHRQTKPKEVTIARPFVYHKPAPTHPWRNYKLQPATIKMESRVKPPCRRQRQKASIHC